MPSAPAKVGKATHSIKDLVPSKAPSPKEKAKARKALGLDEASYSAKAARAGKDIGKPGKEFSKIASSAAERYGSEEAGKRVAGAVLKNLRKEETDLYDIILSHLLDEGFASDEKSAEAIIVNMSEAWIESIVEAKVDKKLPEHERSGARLSRYDNPSGALALGGGQQRARREEHKERRGKKKD